MLVSEKNECVRKHQELMKNKSVRETMVESILF